MSPARSVPSYFADGIVCVELHTGMPLAAACLTTGSITSPRSNAPTITSAPWLMWLRKFDSAAGTLKLACVKLTDFTVGSRSACSRYTARTDL